ncbi:fructose-bisphosphate aldolase [Microbotryum lychnidis-dioicae p1A1 Lamole]|uniref:Fructose-bisphosphate aldolase n=1 Tax=Microbotryum lychnidis-dioicae (strain p1A1 Lamole / MvSl-1064) TaxID=683840 RepID=U5HJA3_USTV1|nr:fructose-bisphosphate aldolase [Microbotryum lychnidis-dioicae p1A1 Lamole]|eukprot:KDE02346.1 fructose-bisphosphate aldolase [Microbotryum lychnidis-dioicae p1A1 Lamole]
MIPMHPHSGVITGQNLIKLLDYAREKHFAIPAFSRAERPASVEFRLASARSTAPARTGLAGGEPHLMFERNVTSSSTAVAALEGARDSKAPVILQVSQGGAAFFGGKGLKNDQQQGSIAGAVAAAHYIRAIAPAYGIPVVIHSDHCAKKLLPWFDGMLEADEAYYKAHGEPLFSSHMLDLSEESKEENIETCVKYFKRMAKIDQWLEMEIGITGGEEDGVDNTGVDNASLYTQPEDILDIHNALSPISPMFSIAAAFGNVHGVYKPGNVKLQPELLAKHQKYCHEQLKSKNPLPIYLVFHGGSGSTKEEISTAVQNGVIKMNVDTDAQWGYMIGFRDYFKEKAAYLETQVGNPEKPDGPNKKYYDPRVWVRCGEVTMKKRVQESLKDLLTENTL